MRIGCLFLFILLELSFSSLTTFIGSNPAIATNITLPAIDGIVKNINKPTGRFYERRYPKTTLYNVTTLTQFHGVVYNDKGCFFSSESVVVSPCSLKQDNDIFYERIPTQFSPGEVAFIPCLISGSPAPITAIHRCESKLNCTNLTEVTLKEGYQVTQDGHLIIQNSTVEVTGWYRCVGVNICGTITTEATYIDISSPANAYNYLGYVLSRKTPKSAFYNAVDEILPIEDKEVDRELTELRMWRYCPRPEHYSDEVVYFDDGDINLSSYSSHSSLNFWSSNHETNKPSSSYKVAHFNVSHVVSFDKFNLYNMTTTIKFSTDVIPPPIIKPPHNLVFRNSKTAEIAFTVKIDPIYRKSEMVSCYRNGVLLSNDFRTVISLSEKTISINLDCPKSLDTGYYQCGITYDIFYISRYAYVEVEPAGQCEVAVVIEVHAKNVTLSWSSLEAYNKQYLVFIGQSLSFTSDPLLSVHPSITIHDLVPYTDYYWYVTSDTGGFVVDRQHFRTRSDIPSTVVTGLQVVRSEVYLVLSWNPIPSSQQHDKSIYFSLSLESDNSSIHPNHTNFTYTRTIVSNYTSVTIASLTPATRYRATISVCNSMGCATNKTTTITETRYNILTKQPKIAVITTSSKHASVSVTNIIGAKSIFVRYFSVKSDTCYSPSNNKKSTEMEDAVKLTGPISVITGLTMNTKYTIQVQTTNGYSHSPWSDCVEFKTEFYWMVVAAPLIAVVVVFLILVTLRICLNKKYPNLLKDLRDAFHKKHVYLYSHIFEKDHREDWEGHNEIEIIHIRDLEDQGQNCVES